MTLLPPAIPRKTIPQEERSEHGVVPEKEEEANYVHNWLYSVVPVGIEETIWSYNNDGTSESTNVYPLRAYLTGFCRECRKSFSAPIPHDWQYLETQMEVPVYGCVKPGTYR